MKGDNYKQHLFGLIVVLVFAFSFSLVSAQTAGSFSESLVNVINGFLEIVTEGGAPLFGALLGDVEGTGDLFTKVLIFFLVTLITIAVLTTVNLFQDKPWLQFLVGAIVSTLGVRFLPENFVDILALPSGAFVASVSMIVPLFLYMYVMDSFIKNRTLRKSGWILFLVVAIVLWIQHYDKPFFWVYPTAAAACIFLFFIDGTLHNLLSRARAESAIERANLDEIDLITSRIKEVTDALSRATDAKERGRLEKQLARYKANLKELTKVI